MAQIVTPYTGDPYRERVNTNLGRFVVGKTHDGLTAGVRYHAHTIAEGSTPFYTDATYQGWVANRLSLTMSGAAGNYANWVSRTGHRATVNITDLAPIYGGFEYGISAPWGFDVTLSACAIEYPVGVFTPFTWGGGNTEGTTILRGTIQKANTVTINIPKGEIFWLWTWQNSPTNEVAQGPGFSANIETFGDGHLNGAPGGTAFNRTWTVVGTGTVKNCYFPTAIVGTCPGDHCSPVACGDSTYYGGNNVATGLHPDTRERGVIGNVLAPDIGFLNLGYNGTTAGTWLAQMNTTALATLMQYVTLGVVGFGVNDISATTPAQPVTIRANMATLVNYLRSLARPDVPFIPTTVTPNTSTSDGHTTIAGQSAKFSSTTGAAAETLKEEFNAERRRGVNGFNPGYIEAALSFCAPGREAIWHADPAFSGPICDTPTGLHPNAVGYALMRQRNLIDRSIFGLGPMAPWAGDAAALGL
ncbi:hypothetical protein GCM10011360_17340 [Primorskyibacter flagellatus]|uniref:SGNH hydrolase-type esterase domain-containing protein n=1 Tax=Primorskyibacter flagellatus TaxID=1387277 RepID=A0A917EEP5_9RHOB|nr:SGNH/GDSL hydrolase family protein [Primorskyibacter flagellatus]GGE29805.1 hypothetical protein GCM10011360_17340 [Primorskyibacter flagellatus]